MTNFLLCVLVFLTSVAISYASARRDNALLPPIKPFLAAHWQLIGWMAAAVGFVVAVKVTMWVLIPEGIGIWLGMFWGARKSARTTTVTRGDA